jgi:hypothetical protein
MLMDDIHRDQGVGSPLPIPAIVAAVVALVVVAAGVVAYLTLSRVETHRELTIATGSEGGTYYGLGSALARVLEAEGVVQQARVMATEGSVHNMQLIDADPPEADLAFVQGDTRAASSARLVAPLYDEVLHILVSASAADRINGIGDLEDRRVAVGPPVSGTRQLSERVLDHFGISVGEDLPLSPAEAVMGLEDGSVDAAFILTSIPSRLMDEVAEQNAVRFLSLGDPQESGNEADALALVIPSVKAVTIPRSTYVGLPREPVRTIAVSALLVARDGLPPELVRSITQALFEHSAGAGGLEGEELVVAQRIREDYRPIAYHIPFHDGAASYYLREEPPFFVAYAEAISLGLTLMVGAYSGFIALREWMRRRMKNRIDAYLLEIEQQTADLGSMSIEELIEHRDALDRIRHRAFSDLVSERLLADESFSIFQNHLRDEFAAIEARIEERSKSAG